MDLQENTKCCLLRKNNSRLSSRWESILFSSVWNDCFQTVKKQLRVNVFLLLLLLLLLLLVPSSHPRSIFWAVSIIPVSAGPSSSEAFRNMLSCPFSFHLNVKQRVWKTTTPVPFFMYDSSRTSSRGSLLFLFWGRISASVPNKKGKGTMSKTSFHSGNDKARESKDVCQCLR